MRRFRMKIKSEMSTKDVELKNFEEFESESCICDQKKNVSKLKCQTNCIHSHLECDSSLNAK